MRANPKTRRAAFITGLIAVCLLSLGCGQLPQGDSTAGIGDEKGDGLARACEDALGRLDSLLSQLQRDPNVQPEKLAEARVLRDTAADLYLGGEYALALEFVDEAISILGKGT